MDQIFTIGHSTRSIKEFTSILEAYSIEILIDIRKIPHSSYCPQFNEKELKEALESKNIQYQHLKAMGGFRKPRKNSINIGWKNASFRGYADYMQTKAFLRSLQQIEKIAQKKRCVLMCAEAIYWRCHRSLISDALTVRHWKVFHIQTIEHTKLHRRTPFLKVRNGLIIYP